MKETRTVKLCLVGESEKARKFIVNNPDDTKENRTVWIPRSITHHVSKQGGNPPVCVVEVEDWWLENNEL